MARRSDENYYGEFLRRIIDYGEGKIGKQKLLEGMGTAAYYRLRSKINAAAELRQIKIKERNLEVVYITGGSGSGKTLSAKYFAEKFGYDSFVSGSGDDFLDGYDKEECLILDDFRASSMRFMELLKMLDNHTNSSVKSRYMNKDLSNCKLIIITSIYPPCNLYEVTKGEDGEEPAEQLYRRLKHHYFEIDPDTMEIEEFKILSNGSGEFTGKSIGNVIDIKKEKGIKDNPDEDSLFNQFKRDYKIL